MPSYNVSFITLLALSAVSACQALACGETDPASGWIPGPALSMRFDKPVHVNVGTSDKPISVRLDGDYYFPADVEEAAFRDYKEDGDYGLDLQTYRQFRKHMVDIYGFPQVGPVDEEFKDKWIVVSNWVGPRFCRICYQCYQPICEQPKNVCPTLSEGECGHIDNGRMCHWTGSKCARIPPAIVAVCESGCPPLTGWPKDDKFHPKWRLLNSADARNGTGGNASGTVAGGSAACCKRKPQICDGVKQSDCHSVAPSFPGCLPSFELLKGCCQAAPPDPFSCLFGGGSCEFTCSHKRAQLDIPDVCENSWLELHTMQESQQGKPAMMKDVTAFV